MIEAALSLHSGPADRRRQQWEPAEAEAFITHSPVAVSTARNYQNTLRLFCGYAPDARYGWAAKCLEQFDAADGRVEEIRSRGRKGALRHSVTPRC